MKGTLLTASAAAMALATAAYAEQAKTNAQPINCAATVSAIGVSSHVEGGRDFERYRGQVPPGLARARAIENWQQQITSACTAYSPRWWRAAAARVDCEGTPGHEYCTATARPARKLLSYLFPY